MSKLIFVTGGVVSSLGKGIVAASLGNILQAEGFKVKLKKLDPYLNVDPGTMNPVQHGEVFVTDDGGETDLDLGHYERFTSGMVSRDDNITSGKIYQTLLAKERNGEYMGQTVQVVPHVTDLIKNFIMLNVDDYDFTICEVGGTIGDIEGQAFLEAIRQIRYELGKSKTMSIHVTLLPYIAASDEIKTKPSQNSVKELMSYGIVADILVCRTAIPLSASDRKKLSSFCNIEVKNIIEAPDVDNIYKIPIIYAKNGLGDSVLDYFKITPNLDLFSQNLRPWQEFIEKMQAASKECKIAIVGKYVASKDAYKSLIQAIIHASAALDVLPKINLVDAKNITGLLDAKRDLADKDCVIIAGGFGTEGVAGKIEAIKYCRENNVPMLGICFGMQLSVIEFARNVAGISDATSAEFCDMLEGYHGKSKIVDMMSNWYKNGEKVSANTTQIGGSMRLGSYAAKILPDTLAHEIYSTLEINERHRHRYEVDASYAEQLAKHGGIFSGICNHGDLPEIFEVREYLDNNGNKRTLDFFISVQFHPEFKSRPLAAHPLFKSLISYAIK